MSGHSKWHNIQAKKGKADAARGKIFTKIGREIAVAAKQGADPSVNSKLADVIAKAKAANMPNDNIKRSIAKATGELGNVNYETLIYEGYGVGGSAVIVKTLTDNLNRTVGEVRHIFDKFYQADSSHKEEGNGLGLSLVKKILAVSDGEISVENIDVGGCRFTVILHTQ